MNKALHIILIVIGILVVAGGLVFAGAWIGRQTAFGWFQPRYGMMGGGTRSGYGPGIYGGGGMMGRGYGGGGMMGRGYGPGMMYGYGNNTNVTPLTTDQAYQAAQKYLPSLNNSDLKIAEVIVFDNNAYVRVVEQSTGIGAFELLVDPATLAVYPEHGPNMMWNLKYGMMNGGGMMGYYGGYGSTANVSATMPVTAAQALKDAQTWLDGAMPGAKTAPDADPFYGYYTIEILRDGKTTGMLSVNGFSGQVFLHTWHGTFITSQDY